ncbi:MAG TPA: tetratricopeptide repeat protein [Bryobacteraceae bacterium]|nr:tetratricopeptide repeat protein [Bryobacteraceae bacterium]
MRPRGLALAALLAAAQQSPIAPVVSGEDAGYLDSAVCAGCHSQIAEKYRRTGMGRSFYRIGSQSVVEDFQGRNTYYHQASDRHYTMVQRGGRYYQRRHQIGSGGREQNVAEKEIHYVLGSGNHARTYLHETADGQLLQLPVGWYSERGGFWAMNPGYDRPDHMDFRRKIDRECFFCHNAYPAVAPDATPGRRELAIAGAVPEGIDCQRCHGPGRKHVQLAQAAADADSVRRAVVNPARLSKERQLEVCLQCHLESTSHRLPYSIRRYGRNYFSYRPGEPLSDYILHFDRAQKSGDFEIAHSAYRLFQSACFRKSKGALTCTTCHDPHGEESRRDYAKICRNCHEPPLARHTASNACVECHMVKRRTDDVVNAVMTDHNISRRKPAGDPLAPRREGHDTDQTAYKGEVVLLYPRDLTAEASLYLDVAQVLDGSNLTAGISRLEKSIARFQPQRAEFYFELANAYAKTGRNDKAFPWYEQALRRQPEYPPGRLQYAAALTASGRITDAIHVLEATKGTPQDAATLNALGSAYLGAGRTGDAVATLRRAADIDPEIPEIHVNLGAALSRQGEQASAMDAIRTAIRLAPDFAAAHNNLANLLSEAGEFTQADRYFRDALRLQPNYAEAHYNYGRALARGGMLEEAAREFQTALKLKPKFAEAAVSHAMILARQGRLDEAIEEYRRVLKDQPGLAAAQFNLGLAFMRQSKNTLAKAQFEALLRSSPEDYEAHYHLGIILLSEGSKELAMLHFQKARQTPNPQLGTAVSEAIQRASTRP